MLANDGATQRRVDADSLQQRLVLPDTWGPRLVSMRGHVGPKAGEHEGHMGPKDGEHEGHMGPGMVSMRVT